MRIAVLGAGGGLGRNVVDAARAAKHEVVALVRDSMRAELPEDVTTITGDVTRSDDLSRVMAGADATVFCVNPPLGTWLTTFQPLLDCTIAAAHRANTRLVFPANVWIYGPDGSGRPIDESRAPSPTSHLGKLRAVMERMIADAGIRYALVRLPEFYGPRVVTLTAHVFRAALTGRRALWPGPLDVTIELVYMPDAARGLVEIATAPGGDATVFHLPGTRTTPRQFIDMTYASAGETPRAFGVPHWILAAAGIFDSTLRGVADFSHLWKHPALLDGTKYTTHFGPVPLTPLAEAIPATLAWHRGHPSLRLAH